MRLLRVFGIGANGILGKGCFTEGKITMVQRSALYVIKKPVRLYPNEHNTRYSHFITFSYCVDSIPYTGKLFLSPYIRCPQKGEVIEVYYDPEKPENYACYSFGPAAAPAGW